MLEKHCARIKSGQRERQEAQGDSEDTAGREREGGEEGGKKQKSKGWSCGAG